MTATRRMLAQAVHAAMIVMTAGLLAACSSDALTGPSGVTDPAQAVFVTSDIPNFWAAFDAGGSTGSATPVQRQYLDRASPGLTDFRRARNVTAASLAQMVRAFPRYFADIRPFTLRLANDVTLQSRMRDGYRRMKELYPPAVCAPGAGVMGRVSPGGPRRFDLHHFRHAHPLEGPNLRCCTGSAQTGLNRDLTW